MRVETESITKRGNPNVIPLPCYSHTPTIYTTMATRPAPPVPNGRGRGSSRPPHQKPRVGQYIIERTLGTGSFGKVKREHSRSCELKDSRNPCSDGTPGRPQVCQSCQDHYTRYEREGQARNSVLEGLATPTYHQTLRGGHNANGRDYGDGVCWRGVVQLYRFQRQGWGECDVRLELM